MNINQELEIVKSKFIIWYLLKHKTTLCDADFLRPEIHDMWLMYRGAWLECHSWLNERSQITYARKQKRKSAKDKTTGLPI